MDIDPALEMLHQYNLDAEPHARLIAPTSDWRIIDSDTIEFSFVVGDHTILEFAAPAHCDDMATVTAVATWLSEGTVAFSYTHIARPLSDLPFLLPKLTADEQQAIIPVIEAVAGYIMDAADAFDDVDV